MGSEALVVPATVLAALVALFVLLIALLNSVYVETVATSFHFTSICEEDATDVDSIVGATGGDIRVVFDAAAEKTDPPPALYARTQK